MVCIVWKFGRCRLRTILSHTGPHIYSRQDLESSLKHKRILARLMSYGRNFGMSVQGRQNIFWFLKKALFLGEEGKLTNTVEMKSRGREIQSIFGTFVDHLSNHHLGISCRKKLLTISHRAAIAYFVHWGSIPSSSSGKIYVTFSHAIWLAVTDFLFTWWFRRISNVTEFANLTLASLIRNQIGAIKTKGNHAI